jgi:hypothetical protein
MSSNNEDETSSVPGGETSADYMISESGKQTETTKAKKSGFDSVIDKIKEKVTGAGKSIKEGAASTVGRDDEDDKTKDLDSHSDTSRKDRKRSLRSKYYCPYENLREKAAKTIDESEDSEEPA